MDVDDPLTEPIEEGPCEQLHVAGKNDQIDVVLLEPGCHQEIPLLADGMAIDAERRRREAGRTGPHDGVGILAARRHSDDREAGVDQRLQVRPPPADENADYAASILPITSSSPGSGTTAQ